MKKGREQLTNTDHFKAFMRDVLVNAITIDTETTGLGDDAEICEFAAIDGRGNVLINTLIKPSKPIPAEATAIHGITNDMVETAPTWLEVEGMIAGLLASRPVAIYNAEYDIRVIWQTSMISHGKDRAVPDELERSINATCIMLEYAEYRGEWCDSRHQYRWHKLTAAAAHEGVAVEENAHRALADCRMTLGLIKAMAA